MAVTNVHKDPDALTMMLTAEFDATPQRIWQLLADPRQLERWWGPPGYPATFTQHDLAPGSRVAYHMTGPDGQKYHGWWEVLEADPPRLLAVRFPTTSRANRRRIHRRSACRPRTTVTGPT